MNIIQVAKHTRTVCTHQVKDCEFKDVGCPFKVNLYSRGPLPDLVHDPHVYRGI